MKFSLALTGLLASSASASYFALLAVRSASPIHYGAINANGDGIWIGKPPGSYCPSNLNNSCPNSTTTIYDGPTVKNSSLSLGVSVPGGQQVYIDPVYGTVGFTRPHSAAMPEGAILNGWTFKNGTSFGTLSWTGGVYFCSVTGNNSAIGPWQMYAGLPQLQFGVACLGADLIANPATGPGAFEYF